MQWQQVAAATTAPPPDLGGRVAALEAELEATWRDGPDGAAEWVARLHALVRLDKERRMAKLAQSAAAKNPEPSTAPAPRLRVDLDDTPSAAQAHAEMAALIAEGERGRELVTALERGLGVIDSAIATAPPEGWTVDELQEEWLRRYSTALDSLAHSWKHAVNAAFHIEESPEPEHSALLKRYGPLRTAEGSLTALHARHWPDARFHAVQDKARDKYVLRDRSRSWKEQQSK
jgi:hypothetical protein